MEDRSPRYLTTEDPRYQDRVYLITNPSYRDHTEVPTRITDNGNTVEDPNGNIIGHYIGRVTNQASNY